MRTILSFATTLAVALAASHAVVADPDPAPREHPRLAYVASDGTRAEMPLVKARLDAVIRGPIAQITLTQTYANPADAAVDAVYVFPLPDDAAVGGMVLSTGDRRVRAVIKRRDEARAVYDKAKRDGKMAALLDQERPNVFTQSIANLAPREQIEVELSFDVLLQPEDGHYQLALPTVVGPRYIPGDALDAPVVGTGTRPDTDRVPDASRVSPPVGKGTGNAVALAIDLDAGVAIKSVDSPTHKLAIKSRGDTARTIALAKGVTAADRDLVIRWRVAVTQPTVAALADHDGEFGHLALIVQPPPTRVNHTDSAPPREIVFVVDTSGSMAGEPLEIAQAAMRRALASMRSIDRFRIFNFSNNVGGLDGGASLVANKDNLERAIGFVNDMRPAGGTEMLAGIRASLDRPAPDMNTYVCFLTDGFIGNETEIFAAIGDQLDPRTRLFSFGIGSSVNRFLLDRMAKIGHGAADYIVPGNDNSDEVIDRFLTRLDAPVLAGLSIDWGGIDLIDQTPDVLPDLFAGQPIVVVARYRTGGKAEITITGTRNGKHLTYTQDVALPSSGGSGKLLGRLWARRRIEALDRAQDSAGARPEIASEITSIALAHGLMSAYTSFVAVEEKTGRDVAGTTVVVPVELPAGVSPDAVGGELGNQVSHYGVPEPTELHGRSRDSGGYDAEDDAGGGGLSYEGDISATSAERYVHGGFGSRGRWHGTLDGALAIIANAEEPVAGEAPARTGFAVTAAIERRLEGKFGAGLEASLLGRRDRDDITTLSAVVARWALLRLLHLRAGIGAAVRFDGELGLAWHLRAGLSLPLARTLGPELSVRLGQARIDADDDAVTIGVGLGLRF